ncbi:NIPSNAP-domain-containing protein, partial [Butyriboletus roseoflavus]
MLQYQQHPLSCAVDGSIGTAFRSPYNAKTGDYILIDVLSTFEFKDSIVELVFLVAPNNEQILCRSKYECSPDGKCWVSVVIARHVMLRCNGYAAPSAIPTLVSTPGVHQVKPDSVDEYKAAAERYYAGIKGDPRLHVKLTGSWETLVGNQDTFVHILEYENYAGYDKTVELIRGSEHAKSYKALLPNVSSRSTQLAQEFAFFPTAPPRAQGGIFELRSYQLKPGVLLEWENTWRRGIEARRKFVAPVGAWFSQIGRLHQVHHMWQYPSLEARKETREKAWQIDGWAETVSKTAQLAKEMDSFILLPLPYSPLK